MKRSVNILVFAILIGSSSLLLWGGIDNDHDWGGDFASYIMQARSLVQGTSSEFLAANQFTMEQSTYPIAPIAYPWGYSVLLAPMYALFGVNMLAFKSISIASYLLFLALLWFAWPRCYSAIWRFAFVSLFAWNPYFQEFMNQVRSDVPFLLFSTLSIILICRVAVERRWLISKGWDYLLLGLAIAASCLIRANGFLLLFTLALTLFISALQNTFLVQGMTYGKLGWLRSIMSYLPRPQFSKQWILGLFCVSLFFAILVWQAFWSQEQYLFFSYLKRLTKSLIFEQIHYYIDLPTQFFTGVPHQELVYGATIPLAVAGMFQRRGSDYPMILYGVLTLLLYVLSGYTQGLRYIFPVLPLYIHFVLVGLEQSLVLADQKRSRAWKFVGLFPIFLVLYYFVTTSIVNATINQAGQRPRQPGPYLPASQQLFSFISKSTAPDSVIVFPKPHVMSLFTDRLSILIRETNELNRGDYLCVFLRRFGHHQVPFDDIARLVNEGRLSLAYENVDFRVYHITK